MTLKTQLEELKTSPTVLEAVDKEDLVQRMIASIGDPDPELRDTLIYSTFCKLIIEGHLSTFTMTEIFNTCMDDDHLFYRIGEKDDDSVFTRSFSVLVVALILYVDKNDRFLPQVMVEEASEKAVSYLLQEKDKRGHVGEKGWAHAVAHGADLLSISAQHPGVKAETFYPKALEALKHCILREDNTYQHNEDERLSLVVNSMLERGVDDVKLIADWIDSIWNEVHTGEKGPSFMELRINASNFLKTLYFLPVMKEVPSCRVKIEQYLMNDLKTHYRLDSVVV